ncbi:MAG: LCP family protein [Firmicutes bacterium]|nr:LCP family protein [[Eubacterium] siraeum]MCM1488560.1 LCP family protein [Bacillota bacterium]
MAHKKRKSNWYIYFITFAVTAALAAMGLSIVWDIIFVPKTDYSSTGIKSNVPDASNNLITLFMLSEEKAANPSRYLLVSYLPAEETVTCVPIRSNMQAQVGSKLRTIDEFYSEGGVNSVMYAIEGTVGVKCDRYVKLDRASFVSMVDVIGKVNVSCAYDVYANDGAILFETGSQSMTGSDLYLYLNYDNADYGEDYQSLVMGSVSVQIINSNLRGLSSTVIQSYFSKLMNTADSNLTLEDYTKRQQAFLFTSSESINPGQYYIPYGETADGVFVLSSDSRATILERMGVSS